LKPYASISMLALLLCLTILVAVGAVEAANYIEVEERHGEAGQPDLAIPINGEWEDSLLGYTISLEFDTDFLAVTEVSLTGTVAEGAEYFTPQWNNEAGYLTAEVVMGTEYPGDYGQSLPAGTGCLLSVVFDIVQDADDASTTDLSLLDGLGVPPRQNRFYWNDGTAVIPTLVDGSVTTIYVWESDFEDDDGGFYPDGEWEWGEDPWDASNHLWGTDLDGYYDVSSCYGLTGRFEVPEDFETAYLTFKHKYNIDVGKSHGDDGCNVQGIVSSFPPTYEVLEPEWIPYDADSLFNACLTYQPAYSGQSGAWPGMIRAAFDITGHISIMHGMGTNFFYVDWMFSSDQWPTTSDGWFIDDVRVVAAPEEAGSFFIRGDVNNDGVVNVMDATYLVNYIYYSGPPPPPPCDRADVDDDGEVNISDVVYISTFLGGGPAPVWPYPNPGIDSSPDDIPLECGGGRMMSPGERDVSPSSPEKLGFRVYQNTPNPFGGMTELRYDLPVAGQVKIEVFDSLGRKVATIAEEYQTAGRKVRQWDAGTLPSGVYFYRLRTDDGEATSKMMLLK
jgi:hypothetical protein